MIAKTPDTNLIPLVDHCWRQFTHLLVGIIFFVFITQRLHSYEENVYLKRINDHWDFNESPENSQLREIFSTIFRKEKTLADEYYQILSGQSINFLFYQIFLKEFYQLLEDGELVDYEFLREKNDRRYKNIDEFFENFPALLNLEDLLRNDAKDPFLLLNAYINDRMPEISSKIISGSLTMETNAPGESALYFFMKKNTEDEKELFFIRELIENVFKKYKIPSKAYKGYIDSWIKHRPKSPYGMLLQIFISKNKINDAAYRSFPLGLKLPTPQGITKFFDEVYSSRCSLDFDCKTPLQLRLLTDALEPDNCRIYRYTTISAQEIKEFSDRLHNDLYLILHSASFFSNTMGHFSRATR